MSAAQTLLPFLPARAGSPVGAVRRWLLPLAAAACFALVWLPSARAERSDRGKPLNVEADSGRYDDGRQTGVFTGNVVVTKGSMAMRAARIEVRQNADGYQFGVATAGDGKLASFRQKREGVDEYIEGEAERIEYDGRADAVRFVERAVIRRFRGGSLADETAGRLITYDNTSEVYTVSGGGAAAATPANPGGRVRAVLTPRDGSPAAVEAAASAAAAAASAAPPLQPSPSLGTRP